MKHITLINGGTTIVDDEDYDYLSQWKWRLGANGYAMRTSRVPDDVPRLMHRIIARTPVGMFTDHVNHHKLDNRRSNLRVCTNSQNGHNKTLNRNNRHGLRGVCYCKQTGKWKAYVTVNGKQHWLGRFVELGDAIKARDRAETQFHGEFAIKNNVGASVVRTMNDAALKQRIA